MLSNFIQSVNLSTIRLKIKKYKNDIILIIIVFLISLFSFAMGYIVAKYQEKEPIQFQETVNSKHFCSLFSVFCSLL